MILGVFLSMVMVSDTAHEQQDRSFWFAPPVMTERRAPPIPIEAWLSNRQQTSYKGVSEKTKGGMDQIKPAGDNYFMRHPGVLADFMIKRPDIVRAFQFARISNDYIQLKKRLLALSEREDLPPLIRYRAFIGLGRAAFRVNRHEETRYFAEKALELYAKSSSPWLSDAHYLLSLSDEAGRYNFGALEHIQKALELDESFIEAHWANVRLLASALGPRHGKMGREQRLSLLDRLLTSLVAITQLTQNRRDFFELAQELQSRGQSAYIDFAAGFCFFHVGDYFQAKQNFKRVVALDPNDPALGLVIQKSRYFLDDMHKMITQ